MRLLVDKFAKDALLRFRPQRIANPLPTSDSSRELGRSRFSVARTAMEQLLRQSLRIAVHSYARVAWLEMFSREPPRKLCCFLDCDASADIRSFICISRDNPSCNGFPFFLISTTKQNRWLRAIR
jgi:hypothetical protein